MSKTLSFLFIILSTFFVYSCMDDEDYTLSPTDRLTFSTDTVAFDTILSGTPTNTYSFKVFNRAGKAIRIPLVRLGLGKASPFKVNIDGTPMTEGEVRDFEIAAKDSMIVYLMANIPPTDNDLPVKMEDKLYFKAENGVEQAVVLSASGQDVITLENEHITDHTILQSRRPYRIIDSLVVEAGATLTLSAGTRLLFHPKAELIVHGTLQVLGTKDLPIEMRGDRLGNMFDGQPYDRIPGQWGGITFKSSSSANYLNYADIHSGLYGLRVDSGDVSVNRLVVENSIIHNTTHDALNLRMANAYIGNSQITNAGGNCVTLRGGDVTFVHCTIARFFLFTGGGGTAFDFANYDGDIRLPLKRLQVANTIITGYQNDEVMGNQNKNYEGDAFEYAFFNCLLNTPKEETENPRLVNCRWDLDDGTPPPGKTFVQREANFFPLPDTHALTFSFQLSADSKAIGGADSAISADTYPTDRLGRPRNTRSDIGCYQWMEKEEEKTKLH